MFIALAHSLPAFLGNAWLAPIESPVPPKSSSASHRAGDGSPVSHRTGSRVILRLDIANRDPDEFPDPGELRFDRSSAALVRSAGAVATKALHG
jgi:hypothetical protein